MEEIKVDMKRYSDGKLEYEIPTLNGVRHGLQKGWYENGNKFLEYLVVNGQFQGIYKRWNRDETRDCIIQTKDACDHGPNIELKYETKIKI